MKANETADTCECGKDLAVWELGQCDTCAGEGEARRAKAGIEAVQQYRRDGETDREFMIRLETQCPKCHAILDGPDVLPGKLGCPACAWTNPYTLRDSLATDGVNVTWVHVRDRVTALVGRGMELEDAVRSVTTDLDAARAELQRILRGSEASGDTV